MKKNLRVLAIFIFIAALLQGGFLVFINSKLVQKEESSTLSADVMNIENVKTVEPEIKKNIIEANAQSIIVSYDSSYISYIVEDGVNCINLKEYKTKNIKFINGQKVNYIRWVSNNRLLILEQSASALNKYELYIYDPLENTRSMISSLDLMESGKIESLETSSLNSEILVKVSYPSGNEIYMLNSSNKFNKLNATSKEIDNIKFVEEGKRLVYDTLKHNRICVGENSKYVGLSEKKQQLLLGVDKSNRVFIGICEGAYISKVYYGLLTESVDFWSNINIGERVKKENLIISEEGRIFELKPESSQLKSIVGDKEYNYKGQFIALTKDGVISVYNNEIIINK